MDDGQLPYRPKHEDNVVACQMCQRAPDKNAWLPWFFLCREEFRNRYGLDLRALAGLRFNRQTQSFNEKVMCCRVTSRSLNNRERLLSAPKCLFYQ